jgi:hypothetical protein
MPKPARIFFASAILSFPPIFIAGLPMMRFLSMKIVKN